MGRFGDCAGPGSHQNADGDSLPGGCRAPEPIARGAWEACPMDDLVLTVVQETRDDMSFSAKWALRWDRLMSWGTPIHGVDALVTLVANTVTASKRTIDRLVINGHGNNTGFRIGSDWIDAKSIGDF